MITVLSDVDSSYYITLLAVGLVILAVGLCREFLSMKAPASDLMLSTTVGILLGPYVVGAIDPFAWSGTLLENEMGEPEGQFPIVYKFTAELMRIVLAVQLVSFALSVPWDYIGKAWRAQAVLLSIIMVAMWLASSLVVYLAFLIPFGSANTSFGFWECLLIGAAVSPTDPVLAGGITTTVLAERNLPSRVRHTLSIESAFNDGVGYPFVALSLLFITKPHTSTSAKMAEFFLLNFIYQIIVAALAGIVVGYLVGRLLKWAEPKKLHDKQLLVALTIAFAFIFVGSFRLLNLDELIGVVIGATTYALVTQGRHRETREQLQETVDLLFSTVAFILYGMMIPWSRWAQMIGPGRGFVLALGILFLRRLPWVMLAKPLLKPMIRTNLESAFVGWFGPVGIGALFYAAYAVEQTGNEDYWTVVSLIVFVSILAFGLTDTWFTRLYGRLEPEIREQSTQKCDERLEDEEELERIREERERARRLIRNFTKGGSKLNLRSNSDLDLITNLANAAGLVAPVPRESQTPLSSNPSTPGEAMSGSSAAAFGSLMPGDNTRPGHGHGHDHLHHRHHYALGESSYAAYNTSTGQLQSLRTLVPPISSDNLNALAEASKSTGLESPEPSAADDSETHSNPPANLHVQGDPHQLRASRSPSYRESRELPVLQSLRNLISSHSSEALNAHAEPDASHHHHHNHHPQQQQHHHHHLNRTDLNITSEILRRNLAEGNLAGGLIAGSRHLPMLPSLRELLPPMSAAEDLPPPLAHPPLAHADDRAPRSLLGVTTELLRLQEEEHHHHHHHQRHLHEHHHQQRLHEHPPRHVPPPSPPSIESSDQVPSPSLRAMNAIPPPPTSLAAEFIAKNSGSETDELASLEHGDHSKSPLNPEIEMQTFSAPPPSGTATVPPDSSPSATLDPRESTGSDTPSMVHYLPDPNLSPETDQAQGEQPLIQHDQDIVHRDTQSVKIDDRSEM